jgi:hypothetical protein
LPERTIIIMIMTIPVSLGEAMLVDGNSGQNESPDANAKGDLFYLFHVLAKRSGTPTKQSPAGTRRLLRRDACPVRKCWENTLLATT